MKIQLMRLLSVKNETFFHVIHTDRYTLNENDSIQLLDRVHLNFL